MQLKSKPAAPLMPKRFWTLAALTVCAPMMASCAVFARSSVAEAPIAPPPVLTIPADARAVCNLYRLPDNATAADLEVGYATRGAQLVACDAARELAVLTFDRQAEATARQQEARERRRSRACRWFKVGC